MDSLLTFDLRAFTSIVFIDLVMSGDNAVIIGMAAAGLSAHLRHKAILLGIIVATVLRIVFSAITYQLLSLIGLTLAGGILLLWVAYRMWREIRSGAMSGVADPEAEDADPITHPKTVRGAMISIIVADVTMSLDNVLAVAGAAHGAPGMLIFGLVLSIALMAFAANLVAKMLERYKWLAYLGLLVVAYVAMDMIWRGSTEVIGAAAAMGF
ncbi:MAG: TerC family protein [Hyphomicrobiales bacterium]|nr:TerC family protein [Hyphomicrobiales bacterium]MCP5373732.1 TerC family protein [Hyphomicrobiales bacterium]